MKYALKGNLYQWPLLLGIFAACSTGNKLGHTSKDIQLLLTDSALVHAHVGLMVADANTGQVLAAHQERQYFVPASNTKLWTMYAGMKFLGDSLIAGYTSPVNENVILFRSAADPTFLHEDYQRHPLADVLKKYKEVQWVNPGMATTAYGNGWSWNDFTATYMAPRSSFPLFGNVATMSINNGLLTVKPAAVSVLFSQPPAASSWTGINPIRKFDAAGITVMAGRSKSSNMTLYLDSAATLQLASAYFNNTWKPATQPAGATLTPVFSQPTDSMLRPLMHRSDNFFAEQTLLMVSQQWFGYMDEDAVIDSLLKSDLKNMPDKPRWVDGSGLSRYNLFTPADYIWLLQKMKAEFPMQRLQDILPTGNDGTLSNYYQALEGKIFAKTGTLAGVVALSGYLQAKTGRQLLFSMLVNNHNGSAPAVRRAVEKYLLSVWEKY